MIFAQFVTDRLLSVKMVNFKCHIQQNAFFLFRFFFCWQNTEQNNGVATLHVLY